MNIQWNKVTWYSKLVAIVLFIGLPFVGFWYGMQYGQLTTPLNNGGSSGSASSASSTVGTTGAGSAYYSNVSEWQTDMRPDGGFSIAYPIDFTIDDNYTVGQTADWRIGANGNPGIKMLAITIPRTFEPQTNFADATLTVGKSTNNLAVTDCLTPDQTGGPATGVATTTINGVAFSIFKSASAGAGNFYETTSYRTLHQGVCYAVEYTVHSSQIANYPSSYNLQPFNENVVTGVLDRMVGTFKFL